MFKRDHHIKVASILQSLDADVLKKYRCLFGGGTAIVLSRGEYRESVDIDFLCSDLNGYRELRRLLTGKGMTAIVCKGTQLTPIKEIRADQYGIRTMLGVGTSEIKFEIVLEARISLDWSEPTEKICGISSLKPIDMAASKLLANSDRCADKSVYNRDLIDLAMLDLPAESFKSAVEQASRAYGESVVRDLKKAIEKLRNNPSLLDQCMDALQIDSVPKAVLWEKIRGLERNLRA